MRSKAPTSPARPVRSRRRRLRVVAWIGVGIGLLAVLFFGRSLAGWAARSMAERELNGLVLSRAFAWLNRADWIDPRNGRTELLRARCYRQLAEWPQYAKALALAERRGAPRVALRQEVALGQFQQGRLPEGAESQLGELTDAGLSPHDVAAAFVLGYVAIQQTARGEELLRAWEADYPGHPHVLYMRGVVRAAQNDREGSRQVLEQALAVAPDHELVQLALAKYAEAQKQFHTALAQYLQLARLHPDNTGILIGLARVLRQLGRHDQARTVLGRLSGSEPPVAALSIEMAQLDIETGDYTRANNHFDRVGVDPVAAQMMTDHETLTAAALALALSGDTTPAESAFRWIAGEITSISLMHDLQNHLAVDPQNAAAQAEYRDLMRSLASRRNERNPYDMALAARVATTANALPGQRLYEDHCSACHGAQGDGAGRAARHLFPRPRDLRAEPMRLVSTVNGIPTRSDIKNLIREGIPGTSMVANELLNDAQIDQLIEVVLEMRREGLREQFVAQLEDEGEPVDEQEMQDVIQLRTTPGEVVVPPDLGTPDVTALARGKELYVQHTCHSCHGESGLGDDLTPLFDTRGQPAFPRDLVHDCFKGGNTHASIYLRVLLGMPGSPHPANSSLTPTQLVELVQYCQSMGTEPKRVLTNHQRAIQASSRPAVSFTIEDRRQE